MHQVYESRRMVPLPGTELLPYMDKSIPRSVQEIFDYTTLYLQINEVPLPVNWYDFTVRIMKDFEVKSEHTFVDYNKAALFGLSRIYNAGLTAMVTSNKGVLLMLSRV